MNVPVVGLDGWILLMQIRGVMLDKKLYQEIKESLPDGNSGRFIITEKMLVDAPVRLAILQDLLNKRAEEMSTRYFIAVEWTLGGYVVTWTDQLPGLY